MKGAAMVHDTPLHSGRESGMELALQQAHMAATRGEVPVGAVLLDAQGTVLAQAGNRVEELQDPSAHAEMLVMRAAVHQRQGRRLADCTLVVSLEPCPMCAAAMAHFRVGRLVFGAYDPKGGAVEHGPRLPYRAEALHRAEIIGGVREREAGELLKSFFRILRGEESLPPA
ncbi:MAG: nucleoside deaminase [Acetobacter sp.]|uniref:tRNA-specific adenosine deaminase n=2 Tax=Acetobacteraceae TaxID=433 RepID=A0A841QIK4_9PROT|nr:nucleoside deaminase [Acetobacter lovaniensis]MBB6458420.1 tRNA(Arg) A34 adenosine deaminase TadA [Acetobacter lovaniensis]MCI1698830.1 nucleoside deaminase [Acetobacter lovaniensis]MCI1796018.1 nucleoside deaminase [Acetobacter lovaniensis]MCP1240638.1 nucleoside deaminase [Acetobacter lovaniensis]